MGMDLKIRLVQALHDSADCRSPHMCPQLMGTDLLIGWVSKASRMKCSSRTSAWPQGVKPQALSRVRSNELRALIELCIAHDPDHRPQARQLLKHPFFESLRLVRPPCTVHFVSFLGLMSRVAGLSSPSSLSVVVRVLMYSVPWCSS